METTRALKALKGLKKTHKKLSKTTIAKAEEFINILSALNCVEFGAIYGPIDADVLFINIETPMQSVCYEVSYGLISHENT